MLLRGEDGVLCYSEVRTACCKDGVLCYSEVRTACCATQWYTSRTREHQVLCRHFKT